MHHDVWLCLHLLLFFIGKAFFSRAWREPIVRPTDRPFDWPMDLEFPFPFFLSLFSTEIYRLAFSVFTAVLSPVGLQYRHTVSILFHLLVTSICLYSVKELKNTSLRIYLLKNLPFTVFSGCFIHLFSFKCKFLVKSLNNLSFVYKLVAFAITCSTKTWFGVKKKGNNS